MTGITGRSPGSAMTRLIACVGLFVMGLSVASADEYRLYYLGGQSNMHGHGFVKDLPEELARREERVMIFMGNPALDELEDGGLGLWAVLEPGFGTGFASDGKTNTLAPLFGPELTFGQALIESLPDAKIAIVKYALGGTGLARDIGYCDWDPDFADSNRINQYDHALTTIRGALAIRDIDGDGEDDTLIPAGIVWMQGETDAGDEEAAGEYEFHLKRMMNLLRAALRVDDLPVVIGKITDSGMADDGSVMDYIEMVQEAQRDFAQADECATVVTVTDELSYPPTDAWHYNSDGFVRLGAAFAEAVLELESACGVE